MAHLQPRRLRPPSLKPQHPFFKVFGRRVFAEPDGEDRFHELRPLDSSQNLASLFRRYSGGGQVGYVNRFALLEFLLEKAEEAKILSDNYVVGIESLGGWQVLKDLELIGREKIDVIRVLLTAAIRSSEHLENYDNPDSIWREYAQAGTFTAILRRLDRLEKEDRE